MEENKGLLLKSAMTYGLAMGIYWVIKYLFFIFSNTIPALNIVYLVLTLLVPFIAYYLTKRYKQDIGGKISFFHAWRFGTMLYFFAALIVALEHFVFFQFIAPADFLSNSINQMIDVLKDSQVSTERISTDSSGDFSMASAIDSVISSPALQSTSPVSG